MAAVQEKHAQNSGVSTLGVTLDSGVTAANHLSCAIHVANAGSGVTISSMSDDVNGAWTATPNSPITGGPQDGKIWIYYRENVAAGTTTATVVTSASGAVKLQVWERSGLATSGSLHAEIEGSGSGSVPNPGTLTLTENVDIVAACQTTGGTPTAGASFTLDDATGNYWYDGDQSRANTSSTATAFGGPSSGDWIAIAAGFKQASAGGNTIAVPLGTLTLAAFAPTIVQSAHQSIAVPLGALTMTGFVPTVNATANQLIAVPTVALSLTDFVPTIRIGIVIAVPSASLALSVNIPAVISTAHQLISVPVGSLTLAGLIPSVLYSALPYTPASVNVQAYRQGYFANRMIEVGELFVITTPYQWSPYWMTVVTTPPPDWISFMSPFSVETDHNILFPTTEADAAAFVADIRR